MRLLTRKNLGITYYANYCSTYIIAEMAHATAKVTRNNEIKTLWKKGELTQKEIGKIHGLTQTRVNAILYDKLPAYRYCTVCNCRVIDGTALCEKDRKGNRLKREGRREQKQTFLIQKRAQRILIRQREKEERDIRLQKEKETRMQKAQERQRIFNESIVVKMEKKITYQELWGSVPKWHQEGRGRIRHMVRTRDNYTCQNCSLVRTPQEVNEYNKKYPGKMKSLDVHHLGGMCGKKTRAYDSMEDMSKLITLCHKCHFNHPEHSLRK